LFVHLSSQLVRRQLVVSRWNKAFDATNHDDRAGRQALRLVKAHDPDEVAGLWHLRLGDVVSDSVVKDGCVVSPRQGKDGNLAEGG
jgi:hypothetical protein